MWPTVPLHEVSATGGRWERAAGVVLADTSAWPSDVTCRRVREGPDQVSACTALSRALTHSVDVASLRYSAH